MRRAWSIAVVLVLAAQVGTAFADGGVVVASGAAGALRASVLISPAPLRAGPTEWSVLLQDAGGAPVLDGHVGLEIGDRVVPAQRDASTNRLLYTARVDLSEVGTVPVALHVTDHGRLDFEVTVGAARGRGAEHWRVLAIPPVALALFALHQWLRLRERRRRRA
jgi:hypothetical protein